MLRRTLLAGALILLFPATAACGTPDGAQVEDGRKLPAERATIPEVTLEAEDVSPLPDTIPVRQDASVTDTARIDPRLLEVMTNEPDSVVGVLIGLAADADPDPAVLREMGLDIGVTVGRVMTGRIRASRVPSLAAVPGIRSIDLAETIERPRPRVPPGEPDPSPPR
jgi:hypothetical protein